MKKTAIVGCVLLLALPTLASADNPMGYRLLNVQQAAALPRGGGTIGVDVGRAERITNNDLTFDLLRVQGVRQGSAGARAGFKAGDEIVAVDGQVFASVAVFAAYIGSKQPGGRVSMDYIPAGGGPQQAQRIAVDLGGAGAMPTTRAHSDGLSTGQKVAIGAGAAALFGCYRYGCYSRLKNRLNAERGGTLQPH